MKIMDRRPFSACLPIAAMLLAGAALTHCAKNPVTGKRQLVLISEQQEIAVGRESHPEVLAEFGKVEEAELQGYVSAVGVRLAGDSERPDLPWTFTVVDSPVVNAFALPGGYIYLTREILAYMNDEAELAGVLGHEIGHVTARHAVTRLSKAQLVGLGLGLGGIFSETFRDFSELASIGAGVLFLKYSRDAERQADQLGIRYMFQENYDPRRMSDFFRVFEFMREESGGALPNWLASHPAPPDRREATAEQARRLIEESPSRNLTVNREEHLRRLNGLVFGENPREGFVEGGWFQHPDLRFRLAVPSGWQVQNTRSSVVLSESNQQAAVQLTLAPPNARGEERAQQLSSRPDVRTQWVRRERIHGNPAVVGLYQVDRAGSAPLAALAAWVEYRGRLYQLIGLTPARSYSGYRTVLEGAVGSFQELSDPEALRVQPDRLEIYRSRAGETLEEIARRYGNPRAGVEELARLNRIEPGRRLDQGEPVKAVIDGRRN